MEIIIPSGYATYPKTYIMHNNVSVGLATEILMRPAHAGNFKSLFFHLNWYFSSLPAETQAKIYSIYAYAEEVLRTKENMSDIEADMRDIFEDLIGILDAEKIFNWIRPSEMYAWPAASELPRSFDAAGSPKYPEDKTYILREYQQLFALIIQLRACVPIWAAFLDKFPKSIDGIYRDMNLVSMLTASSGITETPAWQRLVKYIMACLGTKEENFNSGVMHGVSVEEYPRWILSQAIMRKLSLQALTPPQENDASPFVIKHLANNIRECMLKGPATFSTPRLKSVNNRETEGNGDNDRSMYEANRVKESVARGDRWTIQIYLEDPHRALRALEPGIDKSIIKPIFNSFKPASYVPTPDQLLIALWTLSPIISPRAEDDLTRLNSVAMCSIAAAVLWHRGHKEIATLLSCEQGAPITRGGLGTATGVRLPRETYAKLGEIYPHSDRPKFTNSAYTPVREIVTETVANFQSHTWNTTLPESMLEEVKNLFADGPMHTLRVAQNTLTLLFDVVIDLAQRPNPIDAVEKASQIARDLNLPSHPVPWDFVPPVHRPLSGDQ